MAWRAFGKSRPSQVAGAVDRLGDARIGGVLCYQHPGAFELEQETGQRVGEHVVHFAGEALTLCEARGAGFGRPALFQVDEERPGLVIGFTEADGQDSQAVGPGQRGEDGEATEALAAEPDDHLQDGERPQRDEQGDPPRPEAGQKENAHEGAEGTRSSRLRAQQRNRTGEHQRADGDRKTGAAGSPDRVRGAQPAEEGNRTHHADDIAADGDRHDQAAASGTRAGMRVVGGDEDEDREQGREAEEEPPLEDVVLGGAVAQASQGPGDRRFHAHLTNVMTTRPAPHLPQGGRRSSNHGWRRL
jgi:hypothetical protein